MYCGGIFKYNKPGSKFEFLEKIKTDDFEKLISEHLNDNNYNFKNSSLFFTNKLNKCNGFCNNEKRRLKELKSDINYDNDKDGMNKIIKFFIEEDCLFHLCLMEIIIRFKNNFYGNNRCFKCFFLLEIINMNVIITI